MSTHGLAEGSVVTDQGFLRDLGAAVDKRREWAVQFLCDLVNAQTTLGNEAPGQEIMAVQMESLGLDVDCFDVDLKSIRGLPGFAPPVLESYSSRPNVVGSHRPRPSSAGKSLILNGHIDVVPASNPELWTTPPFKAAVRDDLVFGRGAADMKAGLVANLLSFSALQDIGYTPAAPVIFQSVIEEECGGNGTLACLARGYKADAAVIPEPFGQTILVAQMGVMWVNVTVTGRSAHVLDTSAGVNAIDCLFEIMSKLRVIEAEWNDIGVRHQAFSGQKHPVNFNLGRIEGGDWASTVPNSASMWVRVGFFPGIEIRSVQEGIEACIEHAERHSARLAGAKVTLRYAGHRAEGQVNDSSAPLFRKLASAHQNVTGKEPAHLASSATTDSRFFALYAGTSATCYGPRGGEIHGVDEWVSIDSMLQVGLVLAVLTADWCGLQRVHE